MEQLQFTFKEIETHLLQDAKPSVYLNPLATCKMAHEKPFSLLIRLKNTEQRTAFSLLQTGGNHNVGLLS